MIFVYWFCIICPCKGYFTTSRSFLVNCLSFYLYKHVICKEEQFYVFFSIGFFFKRVCFLLRIMCFLSVAIYHKLIVIFYSSLGSLNEHFFFLHKGSYYHFWVSFSYMQMLGNHLVSVTNYLDLVHYSLSICKSNSQSDQMSKYWKSYT